MFESLLFVVIQYRFNNILRIVDNFKQMVVCWLNHALLGQRVGQPARQILPEWGVNENDRDATTFASLNQCQNFGEFIQCAKAAGHHHVRGSVFDKHDLAGKKVPEIE